MAIIMISRGTFSGGKAVAELAAKRLGYRCISREEIVREAVVKYGISEAELTAAMNEPPPFWQQGHGRRLAYVRVFSAALLENVKVGNLVYHGHLGHLMLCPATHVLRVRVIADLEFRIKAGMERKHVSREEAIAFIEKIDRQRDKWTRFLYGVEWMDASLYDVLFNLENVSIDVAADTVVHMAGLDVFKPTPDYLKRIDDLILGTRVWSALAVDGHVNLTNITVNAYEGTVTISGGVSSSKEINAITSVARKVEGVRDVIADLGVGPDWYW
jgi:cytidylate kinase